jgi:hypothetical protein
MRGRAVYVQIVEQLKLTIEDILCSSVGSTDETICKAYVSLELRAEFLYADGKTDSGLDMPGLMSEHLVT